MVSGPTMTMTACASWVVASSATAMGMCGHAVVPARRIPSVQLLKHTPHTGTTPCTSAQRWDTMEEGWSIRPMKKSEPLLQMHSRARITCLEYAILIEI